MQCEPGEVAVLREQIASKDAQIVKLQARIAELEREAAERAAGSDVENDPPDETPRRRRKRKQRLAQLKRRLAARDTAAAGGSGDAAGDAGTADQEPSGEGGGADDTAGEDGGADDTAGEDGGADGTPAVSGSAVRLLVGQLEMELLIRLEEIEFKDKINDLQPIYGCPHCAYCSACEAQGEQLAVHCKVGLIAQKKEDRAKPGFANDGSHLLEWYRAAGVRLQADDTCCCLHSADPTLPCTCEAQVADLMEVFAWRMREWQQTMDACWQGEGYYGVASAESAWASHMDEFADRIVEFERAARQAERAARQAHRNL